MGDKIRISELVVKREVYFVGEKEVIERVFEARLVLPAEAWGVKGKINIGVWPVVAFGAGAVNNGALDGRVLGKNRDNHREGVRG